MKILDAQPGATHSRGLLLGHVPHRDEMAESLLGVSQFRPTGGSSYIVVPIRSNGGSVGGTDRVASERAIGVCAGAGTGQVTMPKMPTTTSANPINRSMGAASMPSPNFFV